MKRLRTMILAVTVAMAGGCVVPEEKTVQGTIAVLPKKLDGTWIVKSGGCDGQSNLIAVTPATRIEGVGAAAAGAFIEATGKADGRYLLASDIKVRPGTVAVAPAVQQSSPANSRAVH